MTYHINLIMQTNKIYMFRQILIYHLPIYHVDRI